MRTIRSISPGSVFKVAFVTYGLLLALFGCLFFVVPALLGSTVFSSVLQDNRELAFLGSSTAVILIYVFGVVGISIMQAIFAAIAAVFYNIIARLVGGVRIDLGD